MKKFGATQKLEATKKKKTVTKPKPKATLNTDWERSTVDHARLSDLEVHGLLPSCEAIEWRAPYNEIRPEPREGEVVVFTHHVVRGFGPPGSHFFRSLLEFFSLQPQDLS